MYAQFIKFKTDHKFIYMQIMQMYRCNIIYKMIFLPSIDVCKLI